MGTRIAIDFTNPEQLELGYLQKQLKKITDACGNDVVLSTHTVHAKEDTWNSLVEADNFFEDVYLAKNIDEFIALIKIDQEIKGIDVAKYIISKIQCTHLKLEKLVFLSFVEYLKNTEKYMFQDKIFAFKYGPVVESVYEKYKEYGYEELKLEEDKKEKIAAYDLEKNIEVIIHEMPAKSRLLFAKDGLEKLRAIDSVIEKYGDCSAEKLVSLTHKEGSPWELSYNGQLYKEIPKELILECYK